MRELAQIFIMITAISAMLISVALILDTPVMREFKRDLAYWFIAVAVMLWMVVV